MPFPIIIPLAVAVAKATTSSAALYWGGGAGVASIGGGLFYLFFKRRDPTVAALRPSETPFHATEEKIEASLEEVAQSQAELSKLDDQAKEELVKAKIAYAELKALFEKLL